MRAPQRYFLSLVFIVASVLSCPDEAYAGGAPSPDFDSDGMLALSDLDLLYGAILSSTNPPSFDLSQDGTVDAWDLDHWLRLAGAVNLPSGNPYLYGDANLDGLVDEQDYLIWNSFRFTLSRSWGKGDFDADGFSDVRDFVYWNANKFTSSLRGGGDGTFRVVYDRISRVLWLDSGGSDFVAIVIDGIAAESIDTLADGGMIDGQFFGQNYSNGAEQWFRSSVFTGAGIVGWFPLATYPAGTTADSVLTWTVAQDDGAVRVGAVEDICNTGNVNFGAGPVADVLFVNGFSGPVNVTSRRPIEVKLLAPPGGPFSSRYVLWVWPSLGTNPVVLGPGQDPVGCLAHPTPFQPSQNPQPIRCLRGGVPSIVCGTLPQGGAASPSRAPWTLIREEGVAGPLRVELQGLIEDTGAVSGMGFSVTNRVPVRILGR